MKPGPLVFSLTASLTLASAQAGITFGPIKGQAGQSIRLVSHSSTTGGTLRVTAAGQTQNGTIAITRDRELVWTFRDPAADGTRRGMVRVPGISTATVVKFGAKEDKTTDASPLNGKMFSMTKPPAGEWKFELDGTVPDSRIQTEIEELSVYLKRDWFPTREVNAGDSWEFDPAWVKLIIEKDLSKAQTIGTMRLKQVRTGYDHHTAYIDVSIRSTGGDFKADGSESSASVDLSGQLVVDLKTMLDEKLELKGTVTTSKSTAGESKTVTLPMQLTVTKSFVLDKP